MYQWLWYALEEHIKLYDHSLEQYEAMYDYVDPIDLARIFYNPGDSITEFYREDCIFYF